MAGGLIQLSAYGAQNQYLNGNPQMTFFKAVYRRYTNFSMDAIRIDFEGTSELSIDLDVQLRCKIPRSGDLISKMYFVINLPDIYSGYDPETDIDYKFWWISSIGTNMIKKTNISIGGNKISEMYGEWIEIWHEIFGDHATKSHYDHMTGNVADVFMPQYNGINGGTYPTSTLSPYLHTNPQDATKVTIFTANPYLQPPSIPGRTLYVPLPFWFTTNPGLALPLISLQYHEVHIEIELRKITELYTIIETKNNIGSAVRGQRRRPLSSESHHHIGNFITGNKSEDFVRNTDLGDGNTNIQGWNMDAHLLVNYIYLDKEERTRFSNNSHEYLIEQVNLKEFMGIVGTKTLNLELEHPVKYLVWFGQRDDIVTEVNAHNNYTNWRHEFIPPGSDSYLEFVGADNQDVLFYELAETDGSPIINQLSPTNEFGSINYTEKDRAELPTKFNYHFYKENIIESTRLLFNGIERYASMEKMYFEHVQPYQHDVKLDKKGVHMYSFSLDPTKYQPSGACNMSRIKNVQLEVETVDVYSVENNTSSNETLQHEYKFNINVYAVNYNILRIMSGMAGFSFSS